MSAHSALVILEKSNRTDVSQEEWLKFLGAAREASTKNKEVQILAENVWRIPLKSGMATLCELVENVRAAHFSSRVLFLENDPEWVLWT